MRCYNIISKLYFRPSHDRLPHLSLGLFLFLHLLLLRLDYGQLLLSLCALRVGRQTAGWTESLVAAMPILACIMSERVCSMSVPLPTILLHAGDL